MSETLVDRVAHELARLGGAVAPNVTDEHREKARVIIGAMREPTDAMETAGRDAREILSSTADVWHAMIDAALADRARPATLQRI